MAALKQPPMTPLTKTTSMGLLEEIERKAKEMKAKEPDFAPLGPKPTPPTPVSSTANAFKDTSDYAKLNAKSHQSVRTDTFKTPQKLDKELQILDKRFALSESYTMIEICEKAFSKKTEKLTKEFMACTRDEVRQATSNLRRELSETITSKLNTVLEKISQMQERSEGPVEVDFDPVREMLRSDTSAQIARCEDRLMRTSSEIHEELKSVKEQQKDNMEILEVQIGQELSKNQLLTNKSLDLLVADQVSMLEKTQGLADAIRSLRHELHIDFSTNLDNQMQKHLIEHAVNVDFTDVLESFLQGNRQAYGNCRDILGEIARIQKHMNVDYLRTKHFGPPVDAKGDRPKSPSAFTNVRSLGNPAHSEPPAADGPAMRNLRNTTGVRKASLDWARSFGDIETTTKMRVRDIGSQTDHAARCEVEIQTEKMAESTHKKRRRSSVVKQPPMKLAPPPEAKRAKPMFADADAMKKKARQALSKPQYNVFDFYHTRGCAQRIAKSSIFENVTYLVIFTNSIWLSIDADFNNASLLIEAEWWIQIVEHIYCVYFFLEIAIRFFAFKRKRNCIKDFWFNFDSLLVTVMVVETWVLTVAVIIFGPPPGGFKGGALKVVRIAKMFRISRMARLLRQVPELLVLIKGMAAAGRSVAVFCILWFIIVYVFGILFKQLISEYGDPNVDRYSFRNVWTTMELLLLRGVLPAQANLVGDVSAHGPWLWPIIMGFVILVSLTLLNMLVGVMVDAIAIIGSTQKESLIVTIVAGQLRTALQNWGRDSTEPLTKDDFQKFVAEPQVTELMREHGVDVVALLDTSEILYEDLIETGDGSENTLPFEGLVDLILNTRGANTATVKDVKEQLRVMKTQLRKLEESMLNTLGEEINQLRMDLIDRDQARDMQILALQDQESNSDDEGDGYLTFDP
jgi:voltage-gated sodium channel